MSDLAAMVPADVRDQLRAAVMVLEAHGPAVTRAVELLGRATTRAWLATLGLSDPAQLAGLDVDDPRLAHTDQEWDQLEEVTGIRRGWDLAYALGDAVEGL